MKNHAVTFKGIRTGLFIVLEDGRTTRYLIVNGSLGVSGNDRNYYGIEDTHSGEFMLVGSLAACRKRVGFWLKSDREQRERA